MDEQSVKNMQREQSAQGFATAALVFGILSIISAFCCCPYIFSALGIIFALLSKGAEKILRDKARMGLMLSIIGMVVSIVLTIFSIVMPLVLIKNNPEYKKIFIETYENSLKENERMIREVYGDDVYEEMQRYIDGI